MKFNELKREFIHLYGESSNDIHVYFAPGRVNLIGEHTDYNGGYVFPCALSFGTYLLTRKCSEPSVKFATTNFDHRDTVMLSEPFEKRGNAWINYPLGVMNELRKQAMEIEGLEMLFSGDIPNGAGLSSSASIEMVTGTALNDLFGFKIKKMDLVKIGQNAENNFVGVNCGIMDQFAIGMGAENHALFLNCETLEFKRVPLILKGIKIVITNTNLRRGLAESKYNERRSECEEAVKEISKVKPILNLSRLSMDEYNRLSDSITKEVVKRRAHHVISENDRTLRAITALNKGDIDELGKLMNESHDSLRDDYEVTGKELDTLVEEARKVDGTIGSRMTGAGFGGCTVSLVKEDAIDDLTQTVGDSYEQKIGLKADFYIAEVGDGAKKIGVI